MALTYEEIEALIGRPLGWPARHRTSYWTNSNARVRDDLAAIGRVARLDVRRGTIVFRRAAAG